MPFQDGTGPKGKGPLSGRGLGRCKLGKAENVGFIGTALLSAFALIVKDAANPDGITRNVLRTARSLFFHRKTSLQLRNNNSIFKKEV